MGTKRCVRDQIVLVWGWAQSEMALKIS